MGKISKLFSWKHIVSSLLVSLPFAVLVYWLVRKVPEGYPIILCFGLYYMAIPFLLIQTTLILILTPLYKRIVSKSILIANRCCQSLIIFSIFFIMSYKIAEKDYIYDIRETRIIANKVIESLENFKKDKGTYPYTIDQIIPQYLFNIPYPKVGWNTRFVYDTNGEEYRLGYIKPTGFLSVYYIYE